MFRLGCISPIGRWARANVKLHFSLQGFKSVHLSNIEVSQVLYSIIYSWSDETRFSKSNGLSGTCFRIWNSLELLLYFTCGKGEYTSTVHIIHFETRQLLIGICYLIKLQFSMLNPKKKYMNSIGGIYRPVAGGDSVQFQSHGRSRLAFNSIIWMPMAHRIHVFFVFNIENCILI